MRGIIRNIALLAFTLAGVQNAQNSGKVEIEILKLPANVTIKAGQPTVLNCEFNKPVWCSWYRNGTVAIIADKYEYIHGKEKEYKTDCSMNIRSATQYDYGPWICTFLAHKERKIQSSPVFVNIVEKVEGERDIEFVREPTNVIVEAGQSTELNCQFNKLVKCVWKRNGHDVQISGRYKYIDDKEGKKYDCSIQITHGNHDDHGQWTCTFQKSTPEERRIWSKVFVNVTENVKAEQKAPHHAEMKKIAWVKQPTNVCIEAGQSTALNCQFDKPVKCLWKRNGTEISISGRYNYIHGTEEKKANCSIQITNGTQDDHGPWICTFQESESEEMPILTCQVFVNIAAKVKDTEIKTTTDTIFRSDAFTDVENLDFSKLESTWILMACVVSILLIVTISNTIIMVITCYRSSKSKSCPTGQSMVIEESGPIRSSEDDYQVTTINEVYESLS